MEVIETYGFISLLPVTVVIAAAIITKRALEPLMLGALIGFFILKKDGFIVAFLDAFYIELSNSAYFVIIFGLFGIFIKLLERSKAVNSFTQWGLKFATSKKKTGFLTWFMGMIFFLDNYFSILGAGVSNRAIADENKMSREFFACSVNMVACAACVLVPMSLWGVFMSGTIDGLKILEVSGMAAITKAVPFIFFAWISAAFVLLYQFKIIPLFGPLKAAENRALTTGKVLPYEKDNDYIDKEEAKTNILNFMVPMIGLIGITLWMKELTYGLITGIIICYALYIIQRLIKPGEAFDIIGEGFQDMFIVTAIVLTAFVLQQANEALGLAPFVVNSVAPIINVQLLPAISFIVLLALGFVTGSFWGMMAVCFPIMLPMADMMGANMFLTIGAVIAGAAAGSTTCFYGDSVTLTCGITGIKNVDYARTALPIIAPVVVVTFIAYLIAGMIMI